ncbi:hypothetical protein ACOI1C_04370 [Bacillus sp. DJP31]|uniref:hypothetical protein n=1 Tax=Bacillus sp. DJP31 TaxID=3409789 RepID=UPI003BB6894A
MRYPFKANVLKRVIYVLIWVVALLIYEAFTLLPEPWGYFHYGWWSLWHTALVNPILLFTVVLFYKWICKLEGRPDIQ